MISLHYTFIYRRSSQRNLFLAGGESHTGMITNESVRPLAVAKRAIYQTVEYLEQQTKEEIFAFQLNNGPRYEQATTGKISLV